MNLNIDLLIVRSKEINDEKIHDIIQKDLGDLETYLVKLGSYLNQNL